MSDNSRSPNKAGDSGSRRSRLIGVRFHAYPYGIIYARERRDHPRLLVFETREARDRVFEAARDGHLSYEEGEGDVFEMQKIRLSRETWYDWRAVEVMKRQGLLSSKTRVPTTVGDSQRMGYPETSALIQRV